MKKTVDIVIVGAGLVGLSLALSLQKTNLSIAMIEAKPAPTQNPETDERALVLAAGSQRLFDSYQIWKSIEQDAVALQDIHVSEQGHFGILKINAKQEGVAALGYVVDANRLAQALYQEVVAQRNVILLHEAFITNLQNDDHQSFITVKIKGNEQQLQTDLIVAADGTHSAVCELAGLPAKRWGEGYQSLVASVSVDRPTGIAYERFIKEGAIAMVPKKKNYKCICTLPTEQIKKLQQLKKEVFLQQIQQLFGYRLGRWLSIEKEQVFPLEIVKREKIVKPGLVVIGNAAHTVYPLAAQGFNLGLRDVAVLSDMIIASRQANKNLGELEVLQRYEKLRKKDQARVIQFTENLLKFKHARRWSLLGMELLPFVKHTLARQNMGMLSRH